MKSSKDVISIEISVDEKDKKIIGLLADGYTASEIATEIKNEYRSIEYRIGQIKARFQCKTAAQIVAIFLRKKIIQ